MSVIASVHIADVGAGRGLRTLARTPKPVRVDGLRSARVAVASPLRRGVLPSPQLGRVGLIAFWDGEAALDAFVADHPLGERLADGWHARLAPLRAHGSWPGLPENLSRDRVTEHTGPSIVITLGRVRFSQVPRFLKTSAAAETSALAAEGLVWATALARPPFVATVSLWRSTKAISTYAFGRGNPGHPDAIDAGQAKPFHHQEAFVRFRPLSIQGSLSARNPLPAQALAL